MNGNSPGDSFTPMPVEIALLNQLSLAANGDMEVVVHGKSLLPAARWEGSQ